MSKISMPIRRLVFDYSKMGPDMPMVIAVGEPIVAGGMPIQKIEFKSSVWNNANQIDGPVYVVFFEDSDARQIFRADLVTSVVVVKEVEEEAKIPELPKKAAKAEENNDE
jgi:hypothetical protein